MPGARDFRITPGREVLTVEANVVADTKVAAATAAYAARDKVYAAVANEKVLAANLVIPANGYLVLGGAGVNASSAKLAEKLSAASKLYNTTDLGLPFPANDLSNFFRNGGSLSLVYQDITEATDSGHADAARVAAVDHADDTGYAGATAGAHTAGDVLINEIMWGLDGAALTSQYIELHNTTAADIGIDSKEWAIVVGVPPLASLSLIRRATIRLPATGRSREQTAYR